MKKTKTRGRNAQKRPPKTLIQRLLPKPKKKIPAAHVKPLQPPPTAEELKEAAQREYRRQMIGLQHEELELQKAHALSWAAWRDESRRLMTRGNALLARILSQVEEMNPSEKELP